MFASARHIAKRSTTQSDTKRRPNILSSSVAAISGADSRSRESTTPHDLPGDGSSQDGGTDGRRPQDPRRAGSFTRQHESGQLLDHNARLQPGWLADAMARVGHSANAIRRELARAWGYGTFRPGPIRPR